MKRYEKTAPRLLKLARLLQSLRNAFQGDSPQKQAFLALGGAMASFVWIAIALNDLRKSGRADIEILQHPEFPAKMVSSVDALKRLENLPDGFETVNTWFWDNSETKIVRRGMYSTVIGFHSKPFTFLFSCFCYYDTSSPSIFLHVSCDFPSAKFKMCPL